jgi:hypothetical protein
MNRNEFEGNNNQNPPEQSPAEALEKEPVTEEADTENKEIDPKEGILDTEDQINELKSELNQIGGGIEKGNIAGIPITELEEKRKDVLEKIKSLEKNKADWAEENGEEELPEGISIEDDEKGSMMKVNMEQSQIEAMSKEARRNLIDRWKESSVEAFTKIMKTNWRTQDAINLPIVLDIVKTNVPLAIEKQTKKFLDGEIDTLPSNIWLHWKNNSFLELIANKPNQIKELKITFDEESVALADEKELTKQEEEDTQQKQPDLKGKNVGKSEEKTSPESEA